MKLLRPSQRKRKFAMYNALNWYLSDREDEAMISVWEAQVASENLVTYTLDEVDEHCSLRYAGHFGTKRLRKKHFDTFVILKRYREKVLMTKAAAPSGAKAQ